MISLLSTMVVCGFGKAEIASSILLGGSVFPSPNWMGACLLNRSVASSSLAGNAKEEIIC